MVLSPEQTLWCVQFNQIRLLSLWIDKVSWVAELYLMPKTLHEIWMGIFVCAQVSLSRRLQDNVDCQFGDMPIAPTCIEKIREIASSVHDEEVCITYQLSICIGDTNALDFGQNDYLGEIVKSMVSASRCFGHMIVGNPYAMCLLSLAKTKRNIGIYSTSASCTCTPMRMSFPFVIIRCSSVVCDWRIVIDKRTKNKFHSSVWLINIYYLLNGIDCSFQCHVAHNVMSLR